MGKVEADIKADILAVSDRGESLALMEPLVLSEGSRHRGELTDLSLDLAARSAGFRRSCSLNSASTAVASIATFQHPGRGPANRINEPGNAHSK